MGLLNWLKGLQLIFNSQSTNGSLPKFIMEKDFEDLKELLEKKADELADKAFQTPGEYKINNDGSRSTIRSSKYYLIEAEKEISPKWLNDIITERKGQLTDKEIRVIKKIATFKIKEILKNEEELGLCTVDVLDVPDKKRREIKRILDSKFGGRVDLLALNKACEMAGLDCVALEVGLDFFNREYIGKVLIIYHDHAIRFRGFDKDGNIRGVSGNDDGAIRRILVVPSAILNGENRLVLFMRREVGDKHPTRKLSKEDMRNIKIDIEEALDVMFPSKPKLNPAREWYLKGRDFYDNLHRYEEAIAAFDKAIEIDPKDSGYGAWEYKVRCLLELGRYEEVLKVIDKVIVISDMAGWYYRKGEILEKLQRHKEALDAYNKELELIPSDVLAQRSRDKLLRQVEISDGDIVTFKVALEKIEKLAGQLENIVHIILPGSRFVKFFKVTDNAQGEKSVFGHGFFDGKFAYGSIPYSVFVKSCGGEIILVATKTIKKRFFEREDEFFVEETIKLLEEINNIEEKEEELWRNAFTSVFGKNEV